mgnify:CR=1 FL=1
MKQHNLFLMCGVAGSGKSSWIKNNVPNAYVISRDAVRFMLVKEDEEYFSKEKEVFNTFVRYIQESIDSDETPEDIYCDATHITKGSRDKLLNALDLTNVKNVTVIVVRPSLEETFKRNAKRNGREFVPKSVIRRMWYQFERPEEDEDRIFDTKYVEVPYGE